jgi:hypothetical protein
MPDETAIKPSTGPTGQHDKTEGLTGQHDAAPTGDGGEGQHDGTDGQHDSTDSGEN